MGDLIIDSDGFLKLPMAIRHQLGEIGLRPLSNSSGHLLLGRSADNAVLLCGVLGEILVPDLISFFNMFRKTGVLHFELEGGRKALYFQQGEIVFASSTFASEDLGEILFSLGKVEREVLLSIRQKVHGRATLGKLLVEQGGISPRDLWVVTRNQVEGIVYQLFVEQQGSFYFEERAVDQEQLLRLSMNTQNLIMESLRRQDEGALFMRRIVSLDYFPVSTGKQISDLPQVEARMLISAEAGQVCARDLFRKLGLDEFEGMRTLYALLEKGGLQMESVPACPIDGELGQILAIYNSLLKVLYRSVSEQRADFKQEVVACLRDLPQPFSFVLRDIELCEDGTLDGHRIVVNLNGLEEGDKKKLLADSLCELVYMETMAVRRELAAEQAQPLVARVQEITARVRDLVGRTE